MNLREMFPKYRIEYDASKQGRGDDPLLQQIACRHGHIYVHSDSLLGVGTDKRGSVAAAIARLPGVEVWQDADDGIRGQELWSSNGTEAGTVLVKDINAGGRFEPAATGRADLKRGTLTVRVAVAGAGRLVVGPAGRKNAVARWRISAAPTCSLDAA